MASSAGLGRFQPVIPETGVGERLPTQTSRELDARDTLRLVRDDLSDAIDDFEENSTESPKPAYLRGEFGANLAEEIIRAPDGESIINRIASEILRGIEADLETRRQWEEMASRAITFLGLIYEEASGEVSAQGSISKAWATLMLEAALGFWANAHAEMLPADGPVKVRDDKPAGFVGEGSPVARDELAEAFQHDYNHYLTVRDKQYYRDFSRMLFSLGPIGTQFRKVYWNPLRKMPVSEWVKAENLIISNEAADISTAGRITERIPNFKRSDVIRLQLSGWWLDVDLSQPHPDPSLLEKKVGEVEGIRKTIDRPEDQPFEFYECYCERDLEGFEHEDEDGQTGLPLPYRITIEKTSRKIVEIRRNWKEGDEDFRARQRYVMFGLVPGFGLYYLGFAHLLGNTERAATALTREMIDVGMLSIFPAFFAERGALPKGTTQIRVGPMGVVEVDTGMKKAVRDALEALPIRPLDPQAMALLTKLEQNGRNVSGKLEMPVGEGTANIPVGTMIAIVEQGTKVMGAVHKGLHASRFEELELLRELLAEDPSVLTKGVRNPRRAEWQAEEFQDMDLVPSSDPNVPSHVHRLMRAIGLAQLSQMFPEIANKPLIMKAVLTAIQQPDPDQFILPPQPGQQGPSPQEMAAQARLGVAQLQAQMKAASSASQERISDADRSSKERVAQLDFQGEQLKTAASLQGDIARQHDSAREQALQTHADQQHDATMQQRDQLHEQTENERQRAHERHVASLSQPVSGRQF